MRLVRVAVVVLLAFAVRAEGQQEQQEREEREERERHERSKETEKVSDDEALYAMGAILGSKVNSYGLSKKELQIVERGFQSRRQILAVRRGHAFRRADVAERDADDG